MVTKMDLENFFFAHVRAEFPALNPDTEMWVNWRRKRSIKSNIWRHGSPHKCQKRKPQTKKSSLHCRQGSCWQAVITATDVSKCQGVCNVSKRCYPRKMPSYALTVSPLIRRFSQFPPGRKKRVLKSQEKKALIIRRPSMSKNILCFVPLSRVVSRNSWGSPSPPPTKKTKEFLGGYCHVLLPADKIREALMGKIFFRGERDGWLGIQLISGGNFKQG